MTEKRSYRGDW